MQGVVTGQAPEGVLAIPAVGPVVATSGLDGVAARTTGHGVVTVAAERAHAHVGVVDDDVVAVVGVDDDPAGGVLRRTGDLGLVSLDLLAALAGLDRNLVVDGDRVA